MDRVKLKYKQLQIIKHALQYYVKREGATQEDIAEEYSLLSVIEHEVKIRKIKYGL